MTSIQYDITKDGLYIKGVEKTEKKYTAEKMELIKKMLQDNRYTQEEISLMFEVPLSLVQQLKEELDAKK